MTNELINARILVYVLTSSILRVNPNYFSKEALLALGSSQNELVKALKELNEDVSIDDLMIALFQKEGIH